MIRDYWIYRFEFDLCKNPLYRAYIFNFQEDMWKYVYPTISYHENKNIKRKFLTLLRKNKKQFLRYIENPSNTKINAHVNGISNELTDIKDKLVNRKENNPNFRDHIFLQAVERLLHEFGTE